MYFGIRIRRLFLVLLLYIIIIAIIVIIIAIDDNPMQIYWFLNLYAVTGQPILILFTGINTIDHHNAFMFNISSLGTENALLREAKCDEQLTSEILLVLQKIYKNTNINLLNVLHTRWGIVIITINHHHYSSSHQLGSDNFSYGSYSYRYHHYLFLQDEIINIIIEKSVLIQGMVSKGFNVLTMMIN
jgi:hypothetical protein